MNRLGMIIDLSHSSKGVMETVLEKSQSPVIFSHSSAANLTNMPLNIQDDILEKIVSQCLRVEIGCRILLHSRK